MKFMTKFIDVEILCLSMIKTKLNIINCFDFNQSIFVIKLKGKIKSNLTTQKSKKEKLT